MRANAFVLQRALRFGARSFTTRIHTGVAIPLSQCLDWLHGRSGEPRPNSDG